MDIDKLFSMSPSELDSYLESEAELIIAEAAPENQPRLRAIHNRCRLIRQASTNTYSSLNRIQKEMWDSFLKLNEALNDVKKST